MLTISLTTWLVRVLSPVLRPASRWLLSSKRTHPTWHYEMAAVATVLFAVALVTTPKPWMHMGDHFIRDAFLVNWLSVFAVLGSFKHANIGYRMSEAMAEMPQPAVACWEWSSQAWLGKEIIWILVFWFSGAYPAIAGSALFILLPAWRRIHVAERRAMRG